MQPIGVTIRERKCVEGVKQAVASSGLAERLGDVQNMSSLLSTLDAASHNDSEAPQVVEALRRLGELSRSSCRGFISDKSLRDAIAILVRLASHEIAAVAVAALEALASFADRVDHDAVDAVVHCLQSPREDVRLAAVRCLQAMGPDWASAGTPNLIRLVLDDADEEVRHAVCEALGCHGTATEAVPSLIRLAASDEDEQLRIASIHAVLAIDPGGSSLGGKQGSMEPAAREQLERVLRAAGSRGRRLREALRSIDVSHARSPDEDGPSPPETRIDLQFDLEANRVRREGYAKPLDLVRRQMLLLQRLHAGPSPTLDELRTEWGSIGAMPTVERSTVRNEIANLRHALEEFGVVLRRSDEGRYCLRESVNPY